MNINELTLDIDILHYSKEDLNFLINESKCEIFNLRLRLEKEIRDWKSSLETIKKLKEQIYKETKNKQIYELYLSLYDDDLESRTNNYNSISFKNSYNPPTPNELNEFDWKT